MNIKFLPNRNVDFSYNEPSFCMGDEKTSSGLSCRDPFILVCNGKYYLYKNENNKNRIDNGVFAVSVHRGGVLVQPRHKACKNARKADDEALQLHAERPQTMKKAPPLGSFFFQYASTLLLFFIAVSRPVGAC